MPRSLTLVMTDIVDSTQVNERLGDAAMGRLWEIHDTLARDLIKACRGIEVGRSDGFLVLFHSPDDAVDFALGFHRALAELERPLKTRIGVHRGPVTLRKNRREDIDRGATPFEVDGIALPTTARLTSAAAGGQTLTTDATLRLLHRRGRRTQCHGHWHFKGLDESLELFEIGDEEAPFVAPTDSEKAYRVVRYRDVWTTLRDLPNSLPAERNVFVGRYKELKALGRLFDDGARLVTLSGMGGVGKTRLALTYARAWLGSYPGGAWFCELDAARGVDGIAQATLNGLRIPASPGDPIPKIGAAIAGRGHCLVILDTFEQVARHAEATLGVWLAQAPQATFLVTSREVLRVAGEYTQWLTPLAGSEAEALFRQRLKETGRPVNLPEHDEQALPHLMALLDCLPLAIELAAARTRVMSPAHMLERMSERFRLLAHRGGRSGRQNTLRATLDWSWDLLSPGERTALMQLAVFDSGVSLDAAEAVMGPALPDPDDWVPDLLQALVEKSLLVPLGAQRFEMLRVVQDYANTRLASAGEVAPAQARHWRWFAAMDKTQATAHRGQDAANLVTACRRATLVDPAAAIRLLNNAWAVLRFTGPYTVAVELAHELEAALPIHDPARAVVRKVRDHAALMCQLGLASTQRIDVSAP